FTTTPPELAQQLADLQVPIDPTAAINMAWRAAGGPSGPLGAKQGDQYPLAGDGLAQNFAGGKIFFSPATGANAVENDTLAKYESLGGPGGNLGFPIANEADGRFKSASRVSAFAAADKPVIFWTSAHGAFVIRGAIKAAWDKLGAAAGKLGAPTADQAVAGDVVTQRFTGGQVSWDQAKNTFSTQPANLASSLAGLQVPGQKVPAKAAPSANGGGAPNWHRWWLPVAIVAAVLVVIAALAATTLRRRSRTRRGTEVADGADRAVGAGDEAVTESVSQWSPTADGDLASARLGEGYRSPGRPRTVRLPNQPVSDWMAPGDAGLVEEPPAESIESPAEEEYFDEEPYAEEHFGEEPYTEEHYAEEPYTEEHYAEEHF